MKKPVSLFLAILIVFSAFLVSVFAEEENYGFFTVDNLISKVTISYNYDGFDTRFTKYEANGPVTLRINKNRKNLAFIEVYKIELFDLENLEKYLYGDAKKEPLKWDDITYTISLYDDDWNEVGTKNVKEYPGDEYIEQYEITSGYITLKDPGFYLVSSVAWAAAGDLELVEVLADGVKTVDVPYTVISLDNFEPQKAYVKGTFKDVSDEIWYGKDVATCYEIGLMEGKGEGKFDPQGSISIAEALTMVVRINKIYNGRGGTIENIGPKWYDGAIAYAKDKGIIYGDEFDEYTRPATRAELAYIFAKALPYGEYKEINSISELPDVDGYTRYSYEIFQLYNAGIITGSDENLTFKPETNISRAEVAAIITRIVKPENRKKF